MRSLFQRTCFNVILPQQLRRRHGYQDITYLWTRQGWLYLCVILDLWDRKVVGWNVSEGLGAELVVEALRRAVVRRQPLEGLVFHSDRGIQYCSTVFRAELDVIA